jgi:Raf kinase inhibitor-like YbhB/YbcL family protein
MYFRIIAAILLFSCGRAENRDLTKTATVSVGGSSAMKISSTAFADGQSIPGKYTCDGSDTNPPLAFSGAPASAKDLALVVDDPDAPGGTFDHWIVWNIPATTTAVAEGQSPQGVTGRNGFGKNAYGGPCPPGGEHRYQFKLYALDTTLSLPAGSSKADLEQAMQGHIVAEAKIIGRYKRR